MPCFNHRTRSPTSPSRSEQRAATLNNGADGLAPMVSNWLSASPMICSASRGLCWTTNRKAPPATAASSSTSASAPPSKASLAACSPRSSQGNFPFSFLHAFTTGSSAILANVFRSSSASTPSIPLASGLTAAHPISSPSAHPSINPRPINRSIAPAGSPTP